MASSADGNKLAVAVKGEYIYTSADAGLTWTQKGKTQLGPQNWVAITSSGDGSRLVAAPANGPLYASPDSGDNWVASRDTAYWVSVASSADGVRYAALTESGSFIYTGIW